MSALGFAEPVLRSILEVTRGELPSDPTEPLFLYGLSSMSVLRILPSMRSSYPAVADKLTAGSLIASPTLGGWASLLQSGTAPGPIEGVLIQLQRGDVSKDHKAALVFVHPATGLLGLYQGMVGSGSFPGRDVFGLQHPFYTDTLPLSASLAEICSQYKKALLATVKSSQPIVLSVYSSGGVFALELAHQLRHAGRPVSGVVLIDSCIGTSGPADVMKAIAVNTPCGCGNGVGICCPCIYGCIPLQLCCGTACCRYSSRTTEPTYNDHRRTEDQMGTDGFMKTMIMDMGYDFYREGIPGQWRKDPSPFPTLSRQFKGKGSYKGLREAMVKYAKDKFPDEVDEGRFNKMLQVQAESALPSIMAYTNVPLGTMPVLNLYCPADPMNSKLPLLTLASNYTNVPVPYREAEGLEQLFKGKPSTIRAHMLCMLQPTFVERVVSEMVPFLAKIDAAGPAAAGGGGPAKAASAIAPGAPDVAAMER